MAGRRFRSAPISRSSIFPGSSSRSTARFPISCRCSAIAASPISSPPMSSPAGAFFWVTQLTAPDRLFWALELTAYAMAISSTVCGAVLVENGQRLGESGRFVNQQWLWFNAATMVASIVGGELTQRLSPAAALHIAAAIVAVAPLAVLFGTIFLIPDKKTPIDLPALRATFGSLVTAFKRRELWIVGTFPLSLLLQSGLEHAALLLHDRRSEILAKLYRHSRIDRRGRLGRGRAPLSPAVR